MSSDLEKFFQKVEELKPTFKTRLGDAIKIQSVSDVDLKRQMATSLKSQINDLGGDLDLHEFDNPPGLPPLVIGQYPKEWDKSKKTIVVYGHYDVQPADDGDKWKHPPPFELTEGVREVDQKKCYFGRGSTDDKGPVVSWINMLEAYQKANIDLPVNLRFLFEGMEESGSTGLPEFIKSDDGKKLFENADAGVISDNYWLGTTTPCLTYGLRGIVYFSITVSGPAWELHSGLFGGTVYEPMTDLIALLSTLVDSQGKILIPDLSHDVEPLTQEEIDSYKGIDYTMQDLYTATGSKTAIYDDPTATLMARWRYPSLSIHGIEGAYSGPDTKTSIAPKVTGKFSIRTVPKMTVEDISTMVRDHLDREWKKLHSKNTYSFKVNDAGETWRTKPDHPNFEAASRATNTVWGKKPDLTREGGSIPVSLNIQEGLGTDSEGNPKSLVLLPVGTANDGAHGPDESIPIENYVNGAKVLGAYLYEVANEKGVVE
ncbi:hypothetical protein BDV25DRAFT_138529 [Aspergillus avenaceus]|uniref:Peptidase M20 dimerisation domain-containing protein n=1 Tax=Aspergillus avenaceus TaxID=36643 RepID=A0A5N6TZQ1_ASPAV|nr:hypothetical protein BDV25DRAFT_138529 [Aspergillus avenaceus]